VFCATQGKFQSRELIINNQLGAENENENKPMARYCFIKQVLAMMAAQRLMLKIRDIAMFMQNTRQHDSC